MIAIKISGREEYWKERYPNSILLCSYCVHKFPLIINGNVDIRCPVCRSEDHVTILDYGQPPSEANQDGGKESEKDPDTITQELRCDPPGLDDVIGNAKAVRWIKTVLDAFRSDIAKFDGRTKEAKSYPFPHTLFSGSGGTGKTMISEIIAREIDRPIRLQMGQSLTSPGRVGDVLLSLKPGDILFVDEIHGLRSTAQETFYRAMEDRLYVPVSRAGSAIVEPIRLPPFTLISSTTDEWALLPSMLQRFKVRVRMERLSADELSRAMLERAGRKGLALTDEAAKMIGERSHGTPRLAIGLLDGCVATLKASGAATIDREIVEKTCELLGIDRFGLDVVSRKYLGFLSESAKPVRVNVLATRLDGLSRLTVERRIEPDLVFLGLIEKGSDGRRLTDEGRKYIQEQ